MQARLNAALRERLEEILVWDAWSQSLENALFIMKVRDHDRLGLSVLYI